MGTSIVSYVLQGIDAVACIIEADVSTAALPRTTVVGLPDMAVRESSERVRTAIVNSGFEYPFGRITINLAPADLRKEGPVFDLPIALAVLSAGGVIDVEGRRHLDRCMVAGELSLNGTMRPIRGSIALAILARDSGRHHVILPRVNAEEAAMVDGVEIWPADRLVDVVRHLNGTHRLDPFDRSRSRVDDMPPRPHGVDLSEIKGQVVAKRAIAIAAAGRHNLILIGPPGCGKSMLARSLSDLLPPLSTDEMLELTRVYSCAGRLDAATGPLSVRPMRSPHHTASGPSIVGGGSNPRPGEASLAHHGVLFLDELPEFARSTLESLRQPMQDRRVTIARVNATVEFPADFLLVAAANPSRAGTGWDPAYLNRISGPLADRIDMHVALAPVPSHSLRSREASAGCTTNEVRASVERAIRRRRTRQGDIVNSALSGRCLDEVVSMSTEAEDVLVETIDALGLSARGWDVLRRLARTIADLEDEDIVELGHVTEAVGYRLLDRMPN